MFIRGLIGLITVLVSKKGHKGKIFGYSKSISSASHPSLSGFDRQSLVEQTPRIRHNSLSLGNQVSDPVGKQLHQE